jgi:3-hydroxymyristoyl/3-hydroxydecanoyl-(acyl carrier protein) dehydratase
VIPRIPHEEPFRFVRDIVAADAQAGVFSFEFPRTGESFALRMCPALLMVEAMAQGAAAWHGQGATAGDHVDGVLASVDKARFSGRPRPGDPLTIKVRHKKSLGPLTMMEGEVWVHHRLLAQAELVVRRGVA